MPCLPRLLRVVLTPLLLCTTDPAYGIEQEPSGVIEVPMSRSSASSGSIALRYVRLPATGPQPGPPIVYLAGGPGGSGIAGLRGNRAEFFESLREFGDVIGFDQRGTGDSGPEARTCPQSAGFPLDRQGDPASGIDPLRASLAACIDSLRALGTDASGFTTAESADDLEALRLALGAERLTLIGSSYGTHLALAMARRHPESVDRMVLAGVEGPDHTLKLPGNVQANLERVAAAIRTDATYGALLPDPLGTLDSLLRGLERRPARATIIPGVVVVVGRWDLQAFLAEGMGSLDEIERLPARLVTMSRGDFTELARWAHDRRRPGPIQLMGTAMDCASYASPERLERVRREAEETLLGATIDYPLPEICELRGLPRLDEEFRGPLERSIPTLFISGTLDGRTPVSNAEETATGFPAGRHLVLGNVSHGSDLLIASPMIREVVHAFLADDELPATRVDLPPPSFAPFYERSLASDVLQRLEEDGFEQTAAWLEEVVREHAGGQVYELDEGVLNGLGYDLLAADQLDRAIEVFRLNVLAYPEASNPWDSLGEAYMIAGDRERAIENYEKSLERNPANENARRMLERLGQDPLDDRVSAYLDEFTTPGAAVALIENGRVAFARGYGRSDEAGGAVTARTGFNVGSISKTVTAWGVMRLVERGLLELDVPVSRHLTRWSLPASGFDADGVTVRRLLSHTAGLSLRGYPGWGPDAELPTIEASLSGATNGSGGVRLIAEPGSEWRYSGGGYTVLQLLIEEVTGRGFADYMREEVLRPLGMTRSDFVVSGEIEAGSSLAFDEFGEPTPSPRFTALAAAGLHTTVEDLATFAAAAVEGHGGEPPGRGVLRPETVATMIAPVPASEGTYGLGYGVEPLGEDQVMVGHNGANRGWHAAAWIAPSTGEGFVVVTNGSNGWPVHRQVRCDWIQRQTGTRPECRKPIGTVLVGVVLDEGAEAAVRQYRTWKRDAAEEYEFDEWELNGLGYGLLRRDRVADAIAIFSLNVAEYPDSANPYDSLGEAYMIAGDRERAIENYEKSLGLDPANDNARQMLERLRQGEGS